MNSTWDTIAWSLQIGSCLYMAGVISIIQFIHYPSFQMIDDSDFKQFHLLHTRALGFIAGPVMCVELLTAAWLARNLNALLILNLIAVILLWLVTFLLSVPAHEKLAHGFNESAWKILLKTNWIRTALWLLRSAAFIIWLTNIRI